MGRRSGKIQVTSRRGVQVAVLVLATTLLLSAVLLVTTGRPWFWDRLCIDETELFPQPTPLDYVRAGLRAFVGLGLLVVALKDLRGPRLRDPMLIGLLLFFGAVSALMGSAGTLATGILRLGYNRCIVIGPPWSYVYAAPFVVVGAVLLYATVVVLLDRGEGS